MSERLFEPEDPLKPWQGGKPRDEMAVERATIARRTETIEARFQSFHRENPRVYDLLVLFARQLKARGYETAGIRMVWERMRWEVAITTTDPDGFKLNDHYHSRYARLIMEQEKDLDGFFRTRELRAR